jgi:hypothetical protein
LGSIPRKKRFSQSKLQRSQPQNPCPNSTLETLIANFEDHGLDIVDLVGLSGGKLQTITNIINAFMHINKKLINLSLVRICDRP